MSIITENTKQTSAFIIEENDEIRNNDNLRSSLEDNQGGSSIKGNDNRVSKEKLYYSFLRDATASIAGTLLQLGSHEDGEEGRYPKNRKRTVSLVSDADTASTSTITITDPNSIITAKRPRKSSIHALCSRPSLKCYLPVPPTPMMRKEFSNDDHEEEVNSFSGRKLQIRRQNFNETKIPGDIGCISQSLHQYLKPLTAAPRLPKDIVAESPPQMPPACLLQMRPTPPATMSSAVITEHNNCFIMHSYTILPRNHKNHI